MKHILMIAIAVSLAACATPRAYNRIDADARPLLNTMETKLIVTQSEIGSEIDVYYSGAGIIPALIDTEINSRRTKKAEELISPVRNALIDFDFGARLESDLMSALATGHANGTDQIELVRSLTDDFKQTKVASSNADAVMFIEATYTISSTFGEMVTNAIVQVFPVTSQLQAFSEQPDNDDKLVELTDNIYRNVFRTTTGLAALSDRDSNAEVVGEMTSDEIEKALSASITLLAKQISDDLLRDDDNDND